MPASSQSPIRSRMPSSKLWAMVKSTSPAAKIAPTRKVRKSEPMTAKPHNDAMAHRSSRAANIVAAPRSGRGTRPSARQTTRQASAAVISSSGTTAFEARRPIGGSSRQNPQQIASKRGFGAVIGAVIGAVVGTDTPQAPRGGLWSYAQPCAEPGHARSATRFPVPASAAPAVPDRGAGRTS